MGHSASIAPMIPMPMVLLMHNRGRVKPWGAAWVDIERKGHKYNIHFTVIASKATSLLSWKSSQLLELVEVVDSDKYIRCKHKLTDLETGEQYWMK